MIPRAALIDMGKALAKEVARGRPGAAAEMSAALLNRTPDHVLDLFDLMVAEIGKKKPNQPLLDAFSLMLGQGLETLRYGQERAQATATQTLAELERRILAAGQNPEINPGLILVVLNQYRIARLTPGADLRNLMGDLIAQAATQIPEGTVPGSPDEDFDLLVQETGGDPFQIHAEITGTGHALPDEHRAAMAHATLNAKATPIQEAGIGWLLDESPEVRGAALESLSTLAGRGAISPTTLRRLITMRNWLPATECPRLDAVIQSCRRHDVACAPQRETTVVDLCASGIDGAGAQSFFALVKEGRKYAVASLLVKLGVGVADSWVQRGMTKRQGEDLLLRIGHEIELLESPSSHLATVLGHFLAVGLTRNAVPPFGLLDFVETAGLATANPGLVPLDRLIGSQIEAIPPQRRRPASVNRALKASALWGEHYSFAGHWFEDDETTGQLLSGRKRLGDARRIELLLTEVLPARRLRWAEIFAWVGLLLRQNDPSSDWGDFALVAAELHGDRPLAEIPIMTQIAATSVEAWKFKA
ncbi:hypothetical protein [Phaeospirillum tilakii]|uniref:HEAT repeat-containing protein n=1 Tax=Phaeospirillum tilakii TaxID=741673 RepID=A0ABW5CHW4_9PROT